MDSSHSLVNRLNQLVGQLENQVRESAAVTHTPTSSGSTQNTSSAVLQSLFPSVRASQSNPQSNQLGRALTSGGSRNRGGAGRRKPYDRPQGQRQTSSLKPSKPAIKDVILLPHPKMTSVPRANIREELYVRNLVASGVEIQSEMREVDIRKVFEDLFSTKLAKISGYKFQFVRAVGNRLVDPQVNREWDGKLLKHVAGQGPIYLRSWKQIETDFSWIPNEEVEVEDDGSSTDHHDDTDKDDDDGDDMMNSVFASKPSEPQASSSNITQTSVHVDSMSKQASSTGASQRNTSEQNDKSIIPSVICPTCHNLFPLCDIETHADMCCELTCNSSEAERAYNNLMLTMETDALDDYNNCQENSLTVKPPEQKENVKLQDILNEISSHVIKTSSSSSSSSCRVNIQRKFLLDDYIEARKRPWVKPEYALKVVFIGEPAVDDGGPRREFLTEMSRVEFGSRAAGHSYGTIGDGHGTAAYQRLAAVLERILKQISSAKEHVPQEKIHRIQQGTNQLANNTTAYVKDVTSQLCGALRLLRIQHERLKEEFRESVSRSIAVQNKIADKEKTIVQSASTVSRQDQFGGGFGSEQTQLLEDERRRNDQEQWLYEQIAVDEAIIYERENRIRQIEADILDINEILCDLATMVYEQGDMIDSTERNIEKAHSNVENANVQLLKANQCQVSRQDQFGGGFGSEQTQLLEDERRRNDQEQLYEQIAVDEAIIYERENRIRQIEADILDINEILRDLARFYEQGDMIDSTERNIEKAHSNVENANVQLLKASQYQKAARKKMCCILVVTLVLVAVVSLILYFSLK